ncbi:MAG: hypothetical protein ACI841_001048 [Planctomycetota bacterium]
MSRRSPPFAIECDDQAPVTSTELYAVRARTVDEGAGTRRVKPQVRLQPEYLWRKYPTERQAGPWASDLYHEGRLR